MFDDDDNRDREGGGDGIMVTAVLLALATIGAFYLFGDQKEPASARIVHIQRAVEGTPASALPERVVAEQGGNG